MEVDLGGGRCRWRWVEMEVDRGGVNRCGGGKRWRLMRVDVDRGGGEIEVRGG